MIEYLVVVVTIGLLAYGAWNTFNGFYSAELADQGAQVRAIHQRGTPSGSASVSIAGAPMPAPTTALNAAGGGQSAVLVAGSVDPAPVGGSGPGPTGERAGTLPETEPIPVVAGVGAAMLAGSEHKVDEFEETGTALGTLAGALTHQPGLVADRLASAVVNWDDTLGAAWNGLTGTYDDAVAHTTQMFEDCLGGGSGEACYRSFGVAIAATIGRPIKGLGAIARGLTPDMSAGDLLQGGTWSQAWRTRDGSHVVKQVRDSHLHYRLTPDDQATVARISVQNSEALREAGFPVPPSMVPDSHPNRIIQEWSDGRDWDQLSPAAQERAVQNAERMIADAQRSSIVDPNIVDPNPDNFKFDADGNVVSWYDPIRPGHANEMADWRQRTGQAELTPTTPSTSSTPQATGTAQDALGDPDDPSTWRVLDEW